jgi:hypothetical protein
MPTHRTAAAIGALAMTMLSGTCGAQGLSLIENCPANLEPIESPPPTLPVGRAHTYHVTARFIIDVNGAVIAPSVKASQLIFTGTGAVPVPPDVDRTFLDALRKWRYARRSKPCLGNVELEFQHVI